MSTQLLIYGAAAPVSAARHGDCSVEVGGNYAFSRAVNSVPLMAIEFPQAAAEYAIVFAPVGADVTPVVILGARNEQNLYLAESGAWQAKYVPAFLRRYPFVFSTGDDGKTFTLCIDEQFPGLNREGRGERLFSDERKPTPYVERVLQFLQEYRLQFERTRGFCRTLNSLGVLEPMEAQFTLSGGEKMSLGGFQVVDRAKLKALAPERLAELARSDALELVYLHLYSMRNFVSVKDRLAAAQSPADEAAAA